MDILSRKGKLVNDQRGKIDAFRRELDGKPCHSCGSEQYHLILRPDVDSQPGGIFAQCSQCQRARGVEEDLG